MKKILTFCVSLALLVGLSSFAVMDKESKKVNQKTQKQIETTISTYQTVFEHLNYDLNAFITLTPKQFKEITGEKLSLKETVQLKMAQKQLKKLSTSSMADSSAMPQWAYIVLVILGLGFIPIGIMSDWKGNDWWINILLTLCFWIPGVIHGLIIMKKFY